jgi:hypothetical protein
MGEIWGGVAPLAIRVGVPTGLHLPPASTHPGSLPPSPCPLPEGEGRELHIQIPRLQRVFLDELAAGFDLVAHEDAEEVVGRTDVLHCHLQ